MMNSLNMYLENQMTLYEYGLVIYATYLNKTIVIEKGDVLNTKSYYYPIW